jgi:hypothetical protein
MAISLLLPDAKRLANVIVLNQIAQPVARDLVLREALDALGPTHRQVRCDRGDLARTRPRQPEVRTPIFGQAHHLL